MRPLLRKELRALLPFWSLFIFVVSGDLILRPFYLRLDEISWLHVTSLGPDPGELGILFALLAVVTAFSAFPREHDEGTIDYLYALPVSRATIFGAKILAGLLAIWSVVVLGAVTNWLLQSLNPQSFSGEQWRLQIAAGSVLLRLAVVTCFYSYAIMCSWLRRFGVALLGFGAICVSALEDADQALAYVNPLNLMAHGYHGQTLLLPWREMGLHLSIAMGCLVIGGLLWMQHSEAMATWFNSARERRGGRWLLGFGTVLAVGLVLGALGMRADGEEDGDEPTLLNVPFEVARARTGSFVITYPTNLQKRSLRLMAVADQEWRYVQELLGVKDTGVLSMDLTDVSIEHTGLAAWSRARISLTEVDDPEDARFVLVHELTHIAQHQASDGHLLKHGRSVNFFSEGLADFVAYERVARPQRRKHSRIGAIETLRRQRISFESLCDMKHLRMLVHPTADYMIGELWVKALVDSCGADTPRRVLAAMARPEAPKQLSGAVLMRDALQAAGCQLESVLQTQASLIETLRSKYAKDLAQIPRVSGGVMNQDGEDMIFELRVDRPVPEGAGIVVATRADATVEDARYGAFGADADPKDSQRLTVSIPKHLFAGDRFQFAFGVKLAEDVYPIYEPWREARIRAD